MRIRTIVMAGLAAAAVAYLLDPIAGAARRRRIREQITGSTRRRSMREEMPPLPVNVIPTPAREIAERAKDEVADTLHEPTSEDVADTPSQRPVNIADMPRERMRGYLADIREDRPMDDAAIASLVRTKVLGRPDLDTGSLVVDVVQGVAFLRGDLKDRRQVDEVVDLTGAVPGVQEVKDLIHLPESPTGSEQTAARLGDAWNG